MDIVFAIFAGIIVTALSLFGTGIFVCVLTLSTESELVGFAGAGLGVPLSFYLGYLTVRSLLRDTASNKEWRNPSQEEDHGGNDAL